MSIFLKRAVITMACVTAVGALNATPGLAGIVTPTDKTAVSTAAPLKRESDHRHHQRPPGWGWNQRRFRLGR